ncbi:putative ribonuclease H-like domain-containing protein, partial [Tanacetum coccineum]
MACQPSPEPPPDHGSTVANGGEPPSDHRSITVGPPVNGGFEDPEFPNKVYKVEKALYGLHQAPRAWYETLSTYLLENRFRRGTIDKILFIKKDKDDAQEIPDEFYGGAHFLLRVIASTPMETNKAFLKDEEVADVDVHLYRSMIGSLMYLTASRPDIMFGCFVLVQ